MTRAESPAPSLLRQLLRFASVGALGFLADVGGFNLLRYAGGEGPLFAYPLTAKVVSTALGTVVAWLGNRHWAFSHARRDKAHHEFVLFALVAGTGTLIAMSCLWVSHYLLRYTSPLADNISANVVGLGLALAFRFWAYRRHVFTGSVAAGRPDAVADASQVLDPLLAPGPAPEPEPASEPEPAADPGPGVRPLA